MADNLTPDEKPIRFQAILAAAQGDLAKLQEIFREHEEEMSKPDIIGSSLLHSACAGGNIEVIEWLLEKGFDINAVNQFGGSPLFEATYRDNREAVKLLRQKGARLIVPRHIKSVSYMQFATSASAIIIMLATGLRGDLTGWNILLILVLGGAAILNIMAGVKGLMGKQTFANS